MKKKFIRAFLIALGIYLMADGVIHLLNLRLQSVTNIWPASALSYAKLLNLIYASFVFLASILVLVAQNNLKKYQTLIFSSAVWALFHGSLLIFLSLSEDFKNSFLNLPSLLVWISFYNQYLSVEAILAFLYALIIFVWIKEEKHEQD